MGTTLLISGVFPAILQTATASAPPGTACPRHVIVGERFDGTSCRSIDDFSRLRAYVRIDGTTASATEFDRRVVIVLESNSLPRILKLSGFSSGAESSDAEPTLLLTVMAPVPAVDMIDKRSVSKPTERIGEWIVGVEEIDYWGAAKGNPVNCSTAVNTRILVSLSECYYMLNEPQFLQLIERVKPID